ncbi:HAD family phosphatase [Isosphaeraceae bacterium EP7]
MSMPDSSSNTNASPPLAIFDHDGVLVDSLAMHQDAWVEMGQRCGLPVSAELIHETFGMTNPSIFSRIFGEERPADELAQYSDIKEECYRSVAQGRVVLMDGVRELLDRLLAAGFRLAIGSSAVRANLELTVEACGLQGYFSSIASVEDVRRGKPDPEIFLVAAKKAGLDPRRSVVFEDALVGIQAAKSAGSWAVGVGTTTSLAALLAAGADEAVPNLIGYDVNALACRLTL